MIVNVRVARIVGDLASMRERIAQRSIAIVLADEPLLLGSSSTNSMQRALACLDHMKLPL